MKTFNLNMNDKRINMVMVVYMNTSYLMLEKTSLVVVLIEDVLLGCVGTICQKIFGNLR